MSYASNRVQSWSRLRDSWCTTRDIIMFYTPHDHRVANCNRHIAYCEAMIAFWQQGFWARLFWRNYPKAMR